MSPIRRDALPVLVARGFVSAATTWKALLILLAVNAFLALALVRPAASALHETLDSLPRAEALVKAGETTFWTHFTRNNPDVLGNVAAWSRSFAGKDFRAMVQATGTAGSLLFLGLLDALVASVFAGGFAARFSAGESRGRLGAFAEDAMRFSLPSLFLSAVSIAGIGGAWLGLYVATGRLYDAGGLAFEWEAIGLELLRLAAFLVAAGLVRMVVLSARAAMGQTGKASPLPALAIAVERVARAPLKAILIEVTFGVLALAPLAAWGLFAPVWDGSDPWRLALFVVLQQVLVLYRITARVAQLGAVSAWVKGPLVPPAETPPAV